MRSWSAMGAESPFMKVFIDRSFLPKVCGEGNAPVFMKKIINIGYPLINRFTLPLI